MRPWLKICGITCDEDADLVVDAGADAIGLNLVPRSKRYIDRKLARRLADRVRGKLEIVCVVADESLGSLRELQTELAPDWLQLHGEEPAAWLNELPRSFKAVGLAEPSDALAADAYPGSRLLVDAKSGGSSGGTGLSFDWAWAAELCRKRDVILAGGLNPENVAQAYAALHPFGLDVASGVDSPGNPRRKDPLRVAQFVARAHAAAQ
ncbi:MAG TPA: phosphoribosylanthranilate isomerase [Polyangiaceae bacterium]|nr:phosphoribosylanthranilate isomerase [Polyangiaceae bacterium]